MSHRPTKLTTKRLNAAFLLLAASLAAVAFLSMPLSSRMLGRHRLLRRFGAGGGTLRGRGFVPVNATGGPIQPELLAAAEAAADRQGALMFTVRCSGDICATGYEHAASREACAPLLDTPGTVATCAVAPTWVLGSAPPVRVMEKHTAYQLA